MSWFNQGIANFAKSAITQAQKTIDRALDIQAVQNEEKPSGEIDNFFASYGLEKKNERKITDLKPQAEKLAESLWGSFSGSFFEHVDQSKAENLEKSLITDTIEEKSEHESSSEAPESKNQLQETNFLVVVDQPSVGKPESEFTEVSLLSEETETEHTEDVTSQSQEKMIEEVKNESEINLVSDKFVSLEALDKSTDSSKTITQDLTDSEESYEKEPETHCIRYPDIYMYRQTDVTILTDSNNVGPKLVTESDESKEGRDLETKSTDSIASYNSSVGSFVKCMIDDAIKDQDSGRSRSPHSTASSDKSDMVKLESEQNSGHTSADEVETTTSSDVEVISMSSPNGDNLDKISLSPMKQLWLGKTPLSKRADRSESPASDCPSVKSYSRMVPSSRKHALEGSTSSDSTNGETEKLAKTIADLTELLHAREAKLVEISRENINLQDTNNSLTSQLKHSEEVHAEDTKDVTSLTEELSQRLGTMERNLQQALMEKESLKIEVQNIKEEAATRLCAKQVEEMVIEKDTQIQELMQEGEKLSKQQLQQSNIIKKLRAKEKETDNLIKQQKQKIDERGAELDRVRKSLTAKEEIERKQIDAIRQLTNTVQKQEKDFANIGIEITETREKSKNMQITVDTLTKEVTDLRRASQEKETTIQEAALSAEMAAKDELKACLDRAQRDALLTQEGLLMQIEDLRLSLGRCDQQSNRKEDALRQEISDLQLRLQESEVRNQELGQSVSAATRPLLRQIENLQSTFNHQSTTWEQVESNLTERLTKAQNQLSVAVEKERSMSDKYREVSSRLSTLEVQNDILKQEKNRLEIQLETEQTKLNSLEEWKKKELLQKENLKQTYADEISSLKREQKVLVHQLEIEKTVVEAEKRKCALLQDQIKENKERRLSIHLHETSNPPSPTLSLSRFSSVSESYNPWLHEDLLDHSLIMTSSANGSKFNLYEALRSNSATSVLENLQSQLKMREGEIAQLQSEIAQLERVRESMSLEMVNMTTCNEALDEELKELQQQKSNFEDTQQKYNALLQMYGEKVEEADELRLDLIDVKEMYKAQISDLLKKSRDTFGVARKCPVYRV
uniref:TATA element modulatory factor 1 TATA binding domain-containing protein n=1 Tax=Strigamia maritima TaxID=126957 RepID=T1IQY9_STRMM